MPQIQPTGDHNSSTEQGLDAPGRLLSLTGSTAGKVRPRSESNARCTAEQSEKQLDSRSTSWEKRKDELEGSRVVPPGRPSY